MPQVYSSQLFAAVSAKRLQNLREPADRSVIWALRLGLLLFVTYDGALIVRNVTQALCSATGQTPPAWSSHTS